ncbi:MAG: HD domain-containing protein [Actinobacteria bacterium]|nr:HD domain-containing protein [Actinomycetota bacterium]
MDFINKKEKELDLKQKDYIEFIKTTLRNRMSEALYRHSLGTYSYSLMLAEKYTKQEPENKKNDQLFRISVAALLHDYGKIFDSGELQELAAAEKLKISRFERNCSQIIHSFAAPYLLKRDFGIVDKAISHAVKFHTTGSCRMNIIDRIIYIADKVEQTRSYEGIEDLRKLSMENIDLCLLEVYKSNIIYVITRNYLMHPDTSKIWNNICGGYKNAT